MALTSCSCYRLDERRSGITLVVGKTSRCTNVGWTNFGETNVGGTLLSLPFFTTFATMEVELINNLDAMTINAGNCTFFVHLLGNSMSKDYFSMCSYFNLATLFHLATLPPEA